ncbi:actin-binding protein IPP [Frankliniella occidentalis]|uniref:Kelch-like protein diablo n=1 Tax=Frankliniella occidentalis TaxID=133901 RepID=A0A6J1SNK1_FRAOC|nr:actin-binding protein IPP [Frankliniella occidentalis]XP_052121755.1 actin-binding protein IPP [Frankliniella occidentalis]
MPRVKISRPRCHKIISLTSNQSTSAVDTNANNTTLPNNDSSGVYYSHQFPPNILLNMNDLRDTRRFCDVEILCGGKRIQAHRVVLAASSPYFLAMFTVELLEKQQQSVEIHAIDPEILEALIHFIYSGKLRIGQDNVQELMIAADMLQLKEVVTGCTDFLKKELHSSNCIGIYRFADGHNCLELATSAVDFINSHFPEVSIEDEFYELPKDHLARFLASEDLVVDTEFQVFQAAIRWILHDVTQRRQYVFEILTHVRLPLLSTYLLERVINELTDSSLKVALRSVRKDLLSKRGHLVSLVVHPRLRAKKDVFVIGGSKRELVSAWTRSSECTFSSVERFNTFTQEWVQSTPMAIGRILPGVAVLNSKIFVVGGEQESQILANGEWYDTQADTWNKMACMVVPRCEFGLCALNGYLYAVGGWVGEDIGGSIERYDPHTDEWHLTGELPEPRFSMGVVSYEGLIYMVGGCTHARRHLQDLVSFDPVSGEWRTLKPMLVPRSQMGVAVLDGYLYVVGGNNRHHEALQSVERYSFAENEWTKVPHMHVGRASPAVAAADGVLYVIGGDETHEVNFYRAQITISSVECYDPQINKWRECPSLPESRSEAGAVVV